jgi:hypothetical protein
LKEIQIMTSHNREIGRQLKAAHSKWAKGVGEKSRPIRLPSDEHIQFVQTEQGISVNMSSTAVCANMQTNAAGFEGWCVALRLWLPEIAQTITLGWDAPVLEKAGPAERHYARFLFRVQRFQEMFSDWFEIGSPAQIDACEIRAGGDFFLNVAGSRTTGRVKPHREAELEAALVGKFKSSMLSTFKLTTVDRQFPVGVFRTGLIRKCDAVFTGGTSAIDIIGTDEDTISIFELKAGKKGIMVGALGELMFYARVVQAAMGPAPRFRFPSSAAGRSDSSGIGSGHVESATALRAVLLVEEIHPLLEHPDLIPMLNAASASQTASGSVPITFAAWTVSGFEEGAVTFGPLSGGAA